MKFLIVDDIPANRTVLTAVLKHELDHVEIDEAENGQDAILHAESKAYDIIFFDLMMPVIGGLEAIKNIRNGNGLSKNSKICVISAHRNSVAQCKDIEAEKYIDKLFSKPLKLRDLKDWFNQ